VAEADFPGPFTGIFRLVRSVTCPCGHPAASFEFYFDGGRPVFRATCAEGHAHRCESPPAVEEVLSRADPAART
jgi:hypothetical protein